MYGPAHGSSDLHKRGVSDAPPVYEHEHDSTQKKLVAVERKLLVSEFQRNCSIDLWCRTDWQLLLSISLYFYSSYMFLSSLHLLFLTCLSFNSCIFFIICSMIFKLFRCITCITFISQLTIVSKVYVLHNSFFF